MPEFPKTAEALYAAGYRFKNNSQCNSVKCAAQIQWWTTPAGKSIPLDHPTLVPHFGTCKRVEAFRKSYSKTK
jgi:hypothetical protein